MSAPARKQRSEERLLLLGINQIDHLPPMEDDADISLRTPAEIAKRILVLTYLSCVAFDPSLRQEVMRFLIHDNLWEAASENERLLFHKTPLEENDIARIMWRAESISTLLWTINKVEVMGHADQETDLQNILPLLPGFFESTDNFINHAKVRDKGEILDEFDFVFRANWAARELSEKGSVLQAMNTGVLYERYYSLEWVTNTRAAWE